MNVSLYKVDSIKHIDKTNRLDGRYPLRIGRTCEFNPDEIEAGKCMYLYWRSNSDGSPYFGWFRTSLVKLIEKHIDGTLIITTCNSIYTFSPCPKSSMKEVV